jgi:peptidoglycan/xylan/chitin deacetylase (PgdA/CDA1 family)
MVRHCLSLRSIRRLALIWFTATLSVELSCPLADAAIVTSVAQWRNNASAAYSMTWDDGNPSQVYQIEPLYTARGLHGTFYVNPGNSYPWDGILNPLEASTNPFGKFNDANQPAGWVYFPSRGHELGSHTMTHKLVNTDTNVGSDGRTGFSTVNAIYTDLSNSKQKIEEATGQKVVSFAYPYSYTVPFLHDPTGTPSIQYQDAASCDPSTDSRCYQTKTITTGIDNQRFSSFTQPLFTSARGATNIAPAANETTATHYVPNSATSTDFGNLTSWPAQGSYNVPLPKDVRDKVIAAPANYQLLYGNGAPKVNTVDFRDYYVATLLYDKMLNDTIDAGGWGIESDHHTGYDYDPLTLPVGPGPGYTFGDWSGANKAAYVEHLDNIAYRNNNGEIWEDTVGNVTRYIKARDAVNAATGTLQASCTTYCGIMTITVPDTLTAVGDYDVPLTFTTTFDNGWKRVTQITQGGKLVSFKTNSNMHTVTYDAFANGLPIKIVGTPVDITGLPVPEASAFALIAVGLVPVVMGARRCGR